MITRKYIFIASLLFVVSYFLPTLASSQPITNKTVSEQMLIFEERVLDRLDNLSTRISTLEEGKILTPEQANKKVEMANTIVSLKDIMGKFEEFSYILTNLQQQVESMTKANQKTNGMFQEALGKISKDNSYVEKELTYQISAIKMTLQDLNYKLYQTEDTLKKQIILVQKRLGVATVAGESDYPTIASKEEKTTAKSHKKTESAMVSPVVSTMTMEDSYKTAYNDYLRQNYDLAVIGFTTFLQNFPDTSLSDNAQYWIGECYYSQKKMEEAVRAFEELLVKFPQSNKLLETKYKVARSYHEIGNIDKAVEGYESLISDFPETAIADRAKEYINTINKEAEQNNL